jgi:uncharacterized membrane protein YdjX (TVP38/TMEM64 family)
VPDILNSKAKTPHRAALPSEPVGRERGLIRRIAPLAAIVVLAGIVILSGWHRALSLESIVRHHATLTTLVDRNMLTALAAFIAIYVAVVALSLPGGTILTITGGLLFGCVLGACAALIAATVGATIIFLIARSAVGEFLLRRAGPRLSRLAAGFRAHAFSYLLFLRLVPVFPFFLVNLAPALVGVRLMPFVTATALGIIPATFAFAFAGAGLNGVIDSQAQSFRACEAAGHADCKVDFDVTAALTPQLFAALLILGVLALVPVVAKRLYAHLPS